MAITNRERVGKAMDLLRAGLAPYAEREFKSLHKDRAADAARRYHGTVVLDPERVGRDASRIADEVIAHLSALVGAEVRVTLEIEAQIPSGAPEAVVRTVTENARTLKFTSQGFEEE